MTNLDKNKKERSLSDKLTPASGKDKTKVRAATQRSGKYHWRNRAVNM